MTVRIGKESLVGENVWRIRKAECLAPGRKQQGSHVCYKEWSGSYCYFEVMSSNQETLWSTGRPPAVPPVDIGGW